MASTEKSVLLHGIYHSGCSSMIFFSASQEFGWVEHLQSDLFRVELNIKP